MNDGVPEPLHLGPVTLERLKAFAAASGDYNPIHVSAEAARNAGLAGPIVHGMWIGVAIETYLARLEGARISSLSLQFVRPLLAGSCLRIEGRSVGRKDRPLHMRILCRDDQGVLVAVADAQTCASPE
jgi:acyl dehydratase